MERSFVTILMFVLALLFQSCSEPKAVGDLLQKAEAYMEEQPEYSLEMLEAVNKDDLTTRKVQAKYALLYSMALDKNYIDIADDSIIAPAVNYYKNHGSADERLKAYYYWGRVAMNAGEYEDAISRFIVAEKYSKNVSDKIALGRLYKAQTSVYQYCYDTDAMIEAAGKTADLYLSLGDTAKYLTSLFDQTAGYLNGIDTVNAQNTLLLIKEYWAMMNERQKSQYFANQLILYGHTSPSHLREVLNEYEKAIGNKQFIHWLAVAKAYYVCGDYGKASEAIRNHEYYGGLLNDTYFWISGLIYEALDNQPEAMTRYKNYIELTDDKLGYLLEADIRFMKERHESQMQLLRRNYTISILLLCALTLALAVIVIVFKMRWIRKERQLSDEKHRVDIELVEQRQLAERLQHAEEMKRLESEKNNYIKMYDETLAEIERLKNALKDNELDMSVRAHVTERLTLLNKFVAANIVPSFSNEAAEELKHLMDDKRYFIESTRLSFSLAYPEFVKCLQKFGLADNEIGFCCLYTIGLRGKDVANYMGMSSSWYYKFSSNLRKKFDLEEKDTNIDIYLRNLFEKTAR